MTKQIIRVIREGVYFGKDVTVDYCFGNDNRNVFSSLGDAWNVVRELSKVFPEQKYTVVIEQEPPKPAYQYVVKLLNTQMFMTPVNYDSEEKVMEDYKNDRVEWVQRIDNSIKEF